MRPAEGDGLFEDMKFDDDLEGFFSGKTTGIVNLQPSPVSLGSPTPQETEPLKGASGAETSSPMSGVADTARLAAGAFMGGRFGVAQLLMSSAVSGAMEKMVPSSFQPVTEQAGKFMGKAQPWRDFLLPMSVPPASEGCSRITANIYNFQTNYAILFVLQLVLAIVLQPSALITIVLTVLVWMSFLKKNEDPEWKPTLGGMELGPMQRWLLLAAVTAIVLLFVAGGAIFNAALLYLFAMLAHGVLHDPSAQGIPGASPGLAV